ncbi:MAG: DNA polymerase III subunit beta [Armatimonadetes bacterium]|nr:DNA polymerase III subunit beta [Armatimonadota bacterium]
MKVYCRRKDLYEGVQTVGRVVSGRSTLPILSHVLLQAAEGHLRLVATDFEVGMDIAIPATVDVEGAVTVPARIVGDILGSLPDSEVALSVDENNVVELQCLRSEYTIRGLPAQEFPKLPEVQGGRSVEIEQALLRQLINETSFAVSTDETRALLTGALTVLGDGFIKMVATDTHRLAVSSMPAPGLQVVAEADEAEAGVDSGVIIPARALRELARVLTAEAGEKLQIHITRNQVLFRMEGMSLVSRLIDGQFPNFERVIPKEYQKRLVMNTQELLAALRRASSILPRDSANRVVLRTTEEGLLDITAEAGEVGRAHEQIEVTREGEAVEIAFNVRYMMDMLSITEAESVVIELTGALNPGVVKPVSEEAEGRSYLYVLMPMAIQ